MRAVPRYVQDVEERSKPAYFGRSTAPDHKTDISAENVRQKSGMTTWTEAYQRAVQFDTQIFLVNSKSRSHLFRHKKLEYDSTKMKGGQTLTPEQAITIFQQKPILAYGRPRRTESSAVIAKMYGVSTKSVRDIWRGRTWNRETAHLDPSRPPRPPTRQGRPPGRKDSAPRRRRQPKIHIEPQATEEEKYRIGNATLEPDVEDPFHADWPHWERATGFCASAPAGALVASASCIVQPETSPGSS
jgi:hypothetical protein